MIEIDSVNPWSGSWVGRQGSKEMRIIWRSLRYTKTIILGLSSKSAGENSLDVESPGE